ncbi:hypothetical protein OB919_16610 [Halobacteria archaeon AArc-curdl1]|uniref:Uncharacterized protein n=1 Tax=Natronosalvus hydrolyticus TaxID=2979988 RepID=A0AAP2ZAA3_9EURY|nr:hypothetical protein [Halobacteria archaeon AArc-curdl1]
MVSELTVGAVLERARERRRRKRCPDCDAPISIRGLDGEYSWECVECNALGIGYGTRAAALEGAQRRH